MSSESRNQQFLNDGPTAGSIMEQCVNNPEMILSLSRALIEERGRGAHQWMKFVILLMRRLSSFSSSPVSHGILMT